MLKGFVMGFLCAVILVLSIVLIRNLMYRFEISSYGPAIIDFDIQIKEDTALQIGTAILDQILGNRLDPDDPPNYYDYLVEDKGNYWLIYSTINREQLTDGYNIFGSDPYVIIDKTNGSFIEFGNR